MTDRPRGQVFSIVPAITQRKHEEAVHRTRLAVAPVLADLSAHGCDLEQITDVLKVGLTRSEYRALLPVLLHWLEAVRDEDVKESIVCALRSPHARPDAAMPLIREFEQASPGQIPLKWAIGNTLELVADASVHDELVRLVRNPSHGIARQMIVLGLGKMPDQGAEGVLLDLLPDPDVRGHAIAALGRVGTSRSIAPIESFLQHENSWIRAEAKKALLRIEKRRERCNSNQTEGCSQWSSWPGT